MQLSRADDPGPHAEAVQGRIAAIARAHSSLLATSGWSGADLRSLLLEGSSLASPTGIGSSLSVPRSSVRAEAAQAVSMVLHELATNAAKYGALSRSDGRLASPGRRLPAALRLGWRRDRGPAVLGEPRRTGFRTQCATPVINCQLGGTIGWRADGA